MIGNGRQHLTSELDTLAQLLELSADLVRRIADTRRRNQGQIYSLARQIEDVADDIQEIVRNDRVDGHGGGLGDLPRD